jgi:hypothetical protein
LKSACRQVSTKITDGGVAHEESSLKIDIDALDQAKTKYPRNTANSKGFLCVLSAEKGSLGGSFDLHLKAKDVPGPRSIMQKT